MPRFLVETYLARSQAGERDARHQRASCAAEDLTQEGTPVQLQHSIYVPEDEICFFVFDAPVAREAAIAAQRAGLDPLRIVEADSSVKEQR